MRIKCIGYVYETTCLIDGRKYIGQHKWPKLSIDQSYYGSGTHLLNAIEKYGKENFNCRILAWAMDAADLDRLEELYLHEVDAKNNPMYFNGTNRSSGFFNRHPELKFSHKHSQKEREAIRDRQQQNLQELVLAVVKAHFEDGLPFRKVAKLYPECKNLGGVLSGATYNHWTHVREKYADKLGKPEGYAKGENNATNILSEEQVLEICSKYDTGNYTYKQLAEEYHIGKSAIYHIIRGDTWSYLTGRKRVNVESDNPKKRYKGNLTPEEVLKIVELHNEGYCCAEIRRKWFPNFVPSTLRDIINGRTYSEITGLTRENRGYPSWVTQRTRVILKAIRDGISLSKLKELYPNFPEKRWRLIENGLLD